MDFKIKLLVTVFVSCLAINDSLIYQDDGNLKFDNYAIVSTLLPDYDTINRYRRGDGDDCVRLKLMLKNHMLRLCLKRDEQVFAEISRNCSVIVEDENSTETFDLTAIDIIHLTGYVVDRPHSSIVLGYVENGRFYGRVDIDRRRYYVEKINRYASLFERDGFNESNDDAVVSVRNLAGDLNGASSYEREIFYGQPQLSRVKHEGTVKNKLCTLLVLIDNSFLRFVTKWNVREAISLVLHNVQEANSLFRSTDFDGDSIPDNVGFVVKYIVVMKASSGTQLNKFDKRPIEGNDYLSKFSRHPALQKVCLGVAFTAQTFKENVIGLSYTPTVAPSGAQSYAGGICDQRTSFGHRRQNALVITYRCEPRGKPVSQALTELSLAHELAHSFGAEHDVDAQCQGYIMTAIATHRLTYKNFLFSKCSRAKIAHTLKHKSACMVDAKDAFCGNGILEADEDCDCGFSMYCALYDPCCMARGTRRPCKLNVYAGHQCHPSQGPCCMSNCKYRDLSRLGINCRNFSTRTACKSKDGCVTKCVSDSCQIDECKRIGLMECACPPRDSQRFCTSCCLIRNKGCLDAIGATKALLDTDATLFRQLAANAERKLHEIRDGIVVRDFCMDGDCFQLSFRSFNANDFCMANGRIGTCNEHAQCVIAESRQIYPEVRWQRSSSAPRKLLVYEFSFLLLFGWLTGKIKCSL